jgi:adenylate cyclase
LPQSRRFGQVEVRPAERTLLVDGKPADLGARAFDVLLALIAHHDRVVTKNELLDMVWPGLVVEENNLQAQVSNLRKLLGPKAIATIQGRGYQFSLAETELPGTGATAVAAGVAAGVVAHGLKTADAPSTAVLAFANHSGSVADEYFSDGLADELANVLAKIKGLHVAARTSAFSFKGKSDDIASIGQKLHVASVLEGSVRRSGSHVRVSVQLVNVNDGFQIWSETYDRTLDDIFAVQDDIAHAVVSELRTTLMGATATSSNPQQVADEIAHATQARSDNSEAQRLLMQGRFYALRRRADDIERGIALYQRAITLDPAFAGAYANLSHAWLFAAFYSGPKTLLGNHVMACLERARAAAETALRLDATDPMPHVALSWITWIGDHDVVTCLRELTTALTLAPDNAEVLRNMGQRQMCLGRFDEARMFLDKGFALDPLAMMLRTNRLMLARCMGRAQEALQWGLAAVEIEPSSWFAQRELSVA